MKKVFALVLLAGMTFGAQAECLITMVRDNNVATSFSNHGGWSLDVKKFNALCEKLRKNRARIHVHGAATVLAERSVGWAALSLLDADSAVGTASYASVITMVDPYASQDRARLLLVKAINEAAATWETIELALAELNLERKRIRNGR